MSRARPPASHVSRTTPSDPPGAVAPTGRSLPIRGLRTEPPQVPEHAVLRPRLLSRLRGPDEASIVSIVAPAAYGKSTLLAQWLVGRPEPTAWLTLDTRDDDPVVLATDLAYAIDRVLPVLDGLIDVLRSPGPSVWYAVMPRIADVLRSIPGLTLVLDDVDAVTSVEALDMVAWLALHVPRGSQLVVAGRAGGALPLARLRLEHRLVELGIDDLAFTDAEARELIARGDPSLGDIEAGELNAACHGWIGAMHLARLAGVNGALDVGGRVRLDNPYFSDYVAREVLSRMPAGQRQFLKRTSVLRQLSASLCDAVLGDAGSGRILHELHSVNPFVSLVDADGRWYRVHELLRSQLAELLAREDPVIADGSRRRAAAWYAERGDAPSAVGYAVDTGDEALAADLIAMSGNRLFSRGEHVTVLGWLTWAEERGMTGRFPALALAGSVTLALMGDATRSERWAMALERGEPGAPVPEGSPDRSTAAALLRSMRCPSGAETALLDAQRAFMAMPAQGRWYGAMLVSFALTQLMAGLDDKAERALREAVDESRAEGPDVNARAIACGLLARIELQRGDLPAAAGWVAHGEGLRERHRITDQGPQVLQDAMAARVALARGTADEARGHLAHAQPLRPLLTWAIPGLALIARIELARCHLALADDAGARTLVREMGDILHRRPSLGRLEAEVQGLRDRLADSVPGDARASALTAAELRLLPMLATHLSFREIGERLFVSANTVKTQAISIYRKLGASSRSEAVAAAVRVGLLDPAAVSGILMTEAHASAPDGIIHSR